ncbi:hypothetical protein E2C01_095036 [Portunus trituberculatus]|uniref:Uncharacterized protein n=1 Tax=Portunus trituberculatus TaxID=210409 RepID=A0A5B7JS35_PORTR|nr:hypothetical protein [Portunus trituberculatus]
MSHETFTATQALETRLLSTAHRSQVSVEGVEEVTASPLHPSTCQPLSVPSGETNHVFLASK